MMSDTQTPPNYREISKLSHRELAERTTAALETFIQTVRQGGNVAEKAQIYNAYQDERLKRLNFIKTTYGRRAS